MGLMEPGDFYEDDEPVEKILAAFEAGEKFETTPPRRAWSARLPFGKVNPAPAGSSAARTTYHEKRTSECGGAWPAGERPPSQARRPG